MHVPHLEKVDLDKPGNQAFWIDTKFLGLRKALKNHLLEVKISILLVRL